VVCFFLIRFTMEYGYVCISMRGKQVLWDMSVKKATEKTQDLFQGVIESDEFVLIRRFRQGRYVSIQKLMIREFGCQNVPRNLNVWDAINTVNCIVNGSSAYQKVKVSDLRVNFGYIYVVRLSDEVFKIGQTSSGRGTTLPRVNGYNGEIVYLVRVAIPKVEYFLQDVEHDVIGMLRVKKIPNWHTTQEYFVGGNELEYVDVVNASISKHLRRVLKMPKQEVTDVEDSSTDQSNTDLSDETIQEEVRTVSRIWPEVRQVVLDVMGTKRGGAFLNRAESLRHKMKDEPLC
jgi:hypothetical protein